MYRVSITLEQELFDLVVVPGGAEGAKIISQDGRVQRMLQNHYQQGKLVAMICAGSVAAKTAKIALGSALTSHPSVKADLEQGA
jgi:protein DJ-1